MKQIFILFFVFLIGACSISSDRQVDAILSMSQPNSLLRLQGKTHSQVRALVGEPTFVRKETPNESWVFKAPDCALFVFFDKNGLSTFTEKKGSCDKRVTRQLLKAQSGA